MKKYTPKTILKFIDAGYVSISNDGVNLSKSAVAQFGGKPISLIEDEGNWFVTADAEGFKVTRFGSNHRITSRTLGSVLMRDMKLTARTRFYLIEDETKLQKFKLQLTKSTAS